VGHVNSFRSKLQLLKNALENGNLTQYPSCRKLIDEFELSPPPDFSHFSEDIQYRIDQFAERFQDFQTHEGSLLLFTSPITAEIENQEEHFQMDLCDLQEDMFLKSRQETVF